MKTYTYEQIIQERKREYLELMKETQNLKKFMVKTKYVDDYDLKYLGYFGETNPRLVLYVDEKFNLFKKEIHKILRKFSFSIEGRGMFDLTDEIKSDYRIGLKKMIQITDVEAFCKELEKILTSEVALELKRYDSFGIIDFYSLNDYLMIHTLDGTRVSNGNIQLFHDYFPEELYFFGEKQFISIENALRLFKEEFMSSMFSDYFCKNVEKYDALEYQFDDSLKKENLKQKALTGTISQSKILIHKKNK